MGTTSTIRLAMGLACGLAGGAAPAAAQGAAQGGALWSMQAPVRPPVPVVADVAWPRSDLDRFVLARLEAAGFAPAPEADRATLLRRVTLDLTGLPPTPEELAAFLADPAPDAYERVVDRLLASPQHGERMAQWWLDLARYADTNGFDFDTDRQMWAWRDWVVQAFAGDMPYDQFTIEQLAGDLLPDATLSQRIATGFQRNHAVTFEQDGQPGEYRHQYVADRTATFGTTWLGLSVGCAQCHDHKFDPISQRDYYGLYAFWNRMDEKGLVARDNPEPFLELPSSEQGSELLGLERQIAAAELQLRQRVRAQQAARAAWLQTLSATAVPDGALLHASLQSAAGDATSDGGVIEGLGTAGFVDGVRGLALELDGRDTFLQCGQRADMDADQAFTASAWVRVTAKEVTSKHTVVAKIDEAQDARGWRLSVDARGEVQVQLVAAAEDRLSAFTRTTIGFDEWHHVAFTYDGSRRREGLALYVDGVAAVLGGADAPAQEPPAGPPAEERPKRLVGSLRNDGNLRIGGVDGLPLRGRIDEVRLFARALTGAELAAMVLADFAAMTGAERDALGERLFVQHGEPALAGLEHALAALVARRAELLEAVPLVSVMTEMAAPRPTHLLRRGDFLQPDEVVEPAIPAVFGALPEGAPRNRLGLAQWLVRKDNPLVGRVHVNRLWGWVFGQGLVATPADFGNRGERPSHPELLDWLAREFVDGGFRHRAFLRLLVTSSTYRQRSDYRADLAAVDPDNRLLGRAGRWRLDAEALRDQALALGGLLDQRVGGPSVMPWQPADLWPKPSKAGDRHRRGLYVKASRALPFVAFQLFGAPTRDVCTVQRERGATPLQALVLFNDRNFAEAARGLAQRALAARCEDPSREDHERLERAFAWCTQRRPTAAECAPLLDLLAAQRQRYAADVALADAAVAIGDLAPAAEVPTWQIAAWTAVAAVLLNLDEVLVRS
ncbi:MAG: DUF1549 domain-containing protein [Planctomycetes bacterium]|nr:DUF1549 domain-containing protein [Planctomycetota bacterium]